MDYRPAVLKSFDHWQFMFPATSGITFAIAFYSFLSVFPVKGICSSEGKVVSYPEFRWLPEKSREAFLATAGAGFIEGMTGVSFSDRTDLVSTIYLYKNIFKISGKV